MKRFVMSIVALLGILVLGAQTIEDGIKFAYYGRFKSANDVFEKIAKEKPADPQAQYWHGQIHLEKGDIEVARSIYSLALQATNNAPLVLVGMGHVELLEGKAQEARARFDAAIAATTTKKGGDPVVLRAVGRANADGGSAYGDPMYGIEKLNQAAKLQPTNPEIPLNIGFCQLKRGPEYGGEAKKAFERCVEIDPNYARAYYRVGKIFESQKNPDLYLDFYGKAIEKDPAFAPAYLALYNHYSNRDVNKAKEYLDKFIANSDKEIETDYFYADYLFRSGKYGESIKKGEEIVASLNNNETFPKIHKLFAYNYDRLGDSLRSMKEMSQYMEKERPEKIEGDDYAMMASLYAKIPGNEVKADENFEKAVASDSSIKGKIAYADQAANMYAKVGKYPGQFKWLSKKAALKTNLGEADYYYWCDAGIKSAEYGKTEEIAKNYITAFPDKPQGYVFRTRAAILTDKDTTAGTALEAIDQQTAFLMADTVKNKGRILQNHGYKVYYYGKIKNYEKALESCNAILAVDPNNAYATSVIAEIQRLLKGSQKTPVAPAGGKPSGQTPTPPAKPAKP